MSDSLLSIAEELYSLAPAEFTGTRNAWAKRAGADGDAELARQVKVLPKPSTPAWAVNQLIRRHADPMGQVLRTGELLRRAHDDLDADTLRELTRQRRTLTAAVTRQARRLGADLGVRVTDAAARQVEQTLHAAMVDEQAAAAVRSGLLVAALAATGVDPVDVTGAVAVPAALGSTARARSGPSLPARPSVPAGQAGLSVVPEADREQDRLAREKAQARVAQAETTAGQAEAELRRAAERVAMLEARGLQLQEELDEVRRRIAGLEHEADAVEEELAGAEDDRDLAEHSLDRARTALAQARAVRDPLGSAG
ncbi:MAG: hypothetical protein ACRDPB_08840 [Nocardioidaceae bacterium]